MLDVSNVNCDFKELGKEFQENVVNLLLKDVDYASTIEKILKPEFFDYKYLQFIIKLFFSYKKKYDLFPTIESLKTISKSIVDNKNNSSLIEEINIFLEKIKIKNLNGETQFIKDVSLSYCNKSRMIRALDKSIDLLKNPLSKYSEIVDVVTEAIVDVSTTNFGKLYQEDFSRFESTLESNSIFMSTGWDELDCKLNGGWRTKRLVNLIAPTGSGKSHFLVASSANILLQNIDVIFISLELPEEDVLFRFDSYFTNIAVSYLIEKQIEIKNLIKNLKIGKLKVKYFPAEVTTIEDILQFFSKLRALNTLKPRVLVIDYTELVYIPSNDQEHKAIQKIFRKLVNFAKQNNILVLTASQTNREGYDSENVSLNHSEGSYGKNSECDVVFTISRPEKQKEVNTGTLKLKKCRYSSDGVKWYFSLNGSTSKFNFSKNVKINEYNETSDNIKLQKENNENIVKEYKKYKTTNVSV